MKTVIYFLMTVVSLVITITGTINLCTPGQLTTDNIAQVFFTTLLAMGVFLLFGYGLLKLYKKNN